MYYESYTCGRCGKPVKKGATHCPHCGVYFSGTRRINQPASKPASGGLSRSCTTYLIIFAVLACLGGAVWLSDLNKSKKAAEEAPAAVGSVVVGKEATAPQVSSTAVPEREIEMIEPADDLYERALAGEFSGRRVSMLAQGYPTDEEDPFRQTIEIFEDQTGIQVALELSDQFYSRDYADRIRTDAQSGVLADVVALSDYDSFESLTAEGVFLDVRDLIAEKMLSERYDPEWLELAISPGPDDALMSGIWHTYIPGRVVFYALDDFESAGYEVPERWEDLILLSEQIVAEGGTPWCIGLEYAQKARWMATYWLEDILLRSYPLQTYQALVSGALEFESQEIQGALDILSTIWLEEDYVYHDRQAGDADWSNDIGRGLFNEPPDCWMYMDGVYTALDFPASAAYGENYDWFVLPEIVPDYGLPQIVWGNMIAVTGARPEVGALLDYFTRVESMQPWLEDGYSLAAHNSASPDWYANPLQQSMAEEKGERVTYVADRFSMPQEQWEVFSDHVAGYVASALAVAEGPPPVERRGNIVDLINDGSISVKATGRGIDELDLDIENLIDELLDVEIPAGTYFVSSASSQQNMVVRHTRVVQVEPNDLLSTILDAACAEMEDDVPGDETGFTVQSGGSTDLSTLMPVLEAADVDYDVEQAAIWIVTNNADYDDLGTLVSGWGYARVIDEDEAARAMQLVDEAGLNITYFRIWRDREMIAEGASAALARWLRER
jgi:alpha-glucoside transport system substrate-binding protein